MFNFYGGKLATYKKINYRYKFKYKLVYGS